MLHFLGRWLDSSVAKRPDSYKQRLAAYCSRRLRLSLQASRDEQWATRSTGTGDMMGDRLTAAPFDEGPAKDVVLNAAYPKFGTM